MVLEDCNDRFARRLGRTRAELSGRPLAELYASGAMPPSVTPDGTHGAESGSRVKPDAGNALRDVDADALDTSEGTDPIGSRDRSRFRCRSSDSTRSVETVSPDRTRRGTDTDDEEPVYTLVRADGRLIQTIAEVIPRADAAEGFVIFHVDVTRQKRREEQAEVLNRLMRHNVRNDLNLLRGHAKILSSHDDDEVVDSAAVFDRVADRWLGLAETVRDIERLFDEVSTETARVEEVVTSARRTVERELTEACIEIECGVAASKRVSERLHVALVELCENGIKHNDEPTSSDDPTVRITVEQSDAPEWITIHVVDNGPGIPSQELTALDVDGETPLQHGSGLGLWLVQFVVRRLGGEIIARERNGGGTVVSMHVPLADHA
ncbi:sensor histidine kinase [Halobellus captivus]|uniref:sensor histidine kinase n=1 Tax=Halobellus captivus TaxID=2592614 RepID=UPI0011A177C7|nr:HAMP domain-containing sensor histidine kinase [Halobellus captivus]